MKNDKTYKSSIAHFALALIYCKNIYIYIFEIVDLEQVGQGYGAQLSQWRLFMAIRKISNGYFFIILIFAKVLPLLKKVAQTQTLTKPHTETDKAMTPNTTTEKS